jgi:hypothetical protein
MTQHLLKIRKEFADAIVAGDKTFEIRWNDRGFEVGQRVYFQAIGEDGNPIDHPINGRRFRISYMLTGWGLKDGYVAFGIEHVHELTCEVL